MCPQIPPWLIRRLALPLLPFAFLSLVLPTSAVEIYKWKDAAGRTHVSDRPPEQGGAERLRIRTFTGPAETSYTDNTPATQKVVMLSTTWCGVCKQARAWLSQKGIPFDEYDVERSETGKAEYRRLGGKGVPIILVGNQRMNGFSADRLAAMLSRVKERRDGAP